MTLCTYVVHNSNNNSKLQHFVVVGTNCVIVVGGKPSGNLICMHSRGRYKLACNFCGAGAGIHTAQLRNCTAKHVTICTMWSLEG